jgi:2'-5' RNA ligase
VWVGPDVMPTALLKLRDSIQSELGRFGLGKDGEIFTPHVTRGRIHRNLARINLVAGN